MPDETSIAMVKAAVQKRVQYTEAFATARDTKIDELFKELASNLSTDALLLRGEQVEYKLRRSAFDIQVLDVNTRLDIPSAMELLSELLHPLGVAIYLSDERTWGHNEVLFTVYIYKTS